MASKLSALTPVSTLSGPDLLYVVIDPSGTPLSRGITKANLLNPLTIDGSAKTVGINIATPDGTLHVHTATAGTVDALAGADELVLENSGNGGMSILAPNNSNCQIVFGGPISNQVATIVYNYVSGSPVLSMGTNHASGYLAFEPGNSVEKARLTAAGALLINKTSVTSGFLLDVAGNVKYNGAANTVQALSDGANIAVNFDSGYDATVTVAGNRTIDAPTNIKAGGSGSFTITCDATARTITWASAYRLNGSASPVTAFAASSINKVYWHSADGTNVDIDVIYGV